MGPALRSFQKSPSKEKHQREKHRWQKDYDQVETKLTHFSPLNCPPQHATNNPLGGRVGDRNNHPELKANQHPQNPVKPYGMTVHLSELLFQCAAFADS